MACDTKKHPRSPAPLRASQRKKSKRPPPPSSPPRPTSSRKRPPSSSLPRTTKNKKRKASAPLYSSPEPKTPKHATRSLSMEVGPPTTEPRRSGRSRRPAVRFEEAELGSSPVAVPSFATGARKVKRVVEGETRGRSSGRSRTSRVRTADSRVERRNNVTEDPKAIPNDIGYPLFNDPPPSSLVVTLKFNRLKDFYARYIRGTPTPKPTPPPPPIVWTSEVIGQLCFGIDPSEENTDYETDEEEEEGSWLKDILGREVGGFPLLPPAVERLVEEVGAVGRFVRGGVKEKGEEDRGLGVDVLMGEGVLGLLEAELAMENSKGKGKEDEAVPFKEIANPPSPTHEGRGAVGGKKVGGHG